MPGRLLNPDRSVATLKVRPWAGRLLGDWARARGMDLEGDIGESWEFSTMSGSQSVTLGRPLSDVLGRPLPFLAKLIDTRERLSVQVHPRGHEPGFEGQGKEEAWIILDAHPDAKIWAGIRAGVTRDQLREAMDNANARPSAQASAALFDLMECFRVRAGMVFLIPAGTVHAIGGGIFLAEIQQPSDATLRLHDYGSTREIHPRASLEVLELQARALPWPTDAADPTASAAPMRQEGPVSVSRTDGGDADWVALDGAHVHLRIGDRPGRYRLHARVPLLLVPTLGTLECSVGNDSSWVGGPGAPATLLPPGELRLWTGSERARGEASPADRSAVALSNDGAHEATATAGGVSSALQDSASHATTDEPEQIGEFVDVVVPEGALLVLGFVTP